jgi:hypothetical protein
VERPAAKLKHWAKTLKKRPLAAANFVTKNSSAVQQKALTISKTRRYFMLHRNRPPDIRYVPQDVREKRLNLLR